MNEFDRLEEVAKEFYGNLKSVAEQLYITSQAIYAWRTKGIPYKQYKKLEEIGINPEYIKTGEGPKLILRQETRQYQVMEPRPLYLSSFASMVKQFDLLNISVVQMKELKEAMIAKIAEIDKYLEIGNAK